MTNLIEIGKILGFTLMGVAACLEVCLFFSKPHNSPLSYPEAVAGGYSFEYEFEKDMKNRKVIHKYAAIFFSVGFIVVIACFLV